MYQERFYRKHIISKFKIEVSFKESDLLISTDKKINKDSVKEILIKYYRIVEEYIQKVPSFLTSLSPLKEDKEAPAIIKDMISYSRLTGIGPFSSVAGAIALYVGGEILQLATEVIVENGGDIFLKINENKRLGVYLEENFRPNNFSLKIKKRSQPFGIASSSATIGPSLNFGKADLVTVIADNAILADSFATSLSNSIKKEKDVQQALNFSKTNPLIQAILIAFKEKLFLWGDLELEV